MYTPSSVALHHPWSQDTPLFGYCAPQASGRISVSFRDSSRFLERLRQTGTIFRNQIDNPSTPVNTISKNAIRIGMATRASDQKPPETP